MNNEPVAWMAVNELNGSYSTFTNDQKQKLLPHVSQCYAKWIPLYTHPVKELTDEETKMTYGQQPRQNPLLPEWWERELRKAQEK